MNDKLPVDIGAIKRGLLLVENPGRFQVLPGRPLTVLDVGHNPHAARALRRSLINLAFAQKRTAVFSMLSDKDIDGVLEIVKDQFDEWYIAPLDVPRGMTLESLQNKLHEHSIENIQTFATVREAYRAAVSKAGEKRTESSYSAHFIPLPMSCRYCKRNLPCPKTNKTKS